MAISISPCSSSVPRTVPTVLYGKLARDSRSANSNQPSASGLRIVNGISGERQHGRVWQIRSTARRRDHTGCGLGKRRVPRVPTPTSLSISTGQPAPHAPCPGSTPRPYPRAQFIHAVWSQYGHHFDGSPGHPAQGKRRAHARQPGPVDVVGNPGVPDACCRPAGLAFSGAGDTFGGHGVCATGCFGATSSRQRMSLMGRLEPPTDYRSRRSNRPPAVMNGNS